MSSRCRGLCTRDNSTQLILGYDSGQKFCSVCKHRWITKDIRFWSCSQKLRNKARYNKNAESKKCLNQ